MHALDCRRQQPLPAALGPLRFFALMMTNTAARGCQGLAREPARSPDLFGQRFRSIGIAVIKAQRAGGVVGGGDVQIAVAEFGVRSR